jgi:hypothetical protein
MTDNTSWTTLVSDNHWALFPSVIALLAEGTPVPLRRLAVAAEPWRRAHPAGQIWPVAEAFDIARTRLIEVGRAKA